MKTKAKTQNPKSGKLADLKPRKDPKGGFQIGQKSNRSDRPGHGDRAGQGGRGDGLNFNHNETFLAE